MRILVTGATGVVGKRVVPLLLSRGDTVTAVARKPLPGSGANFVAVDLFDREALTRAVDGHDAIVNLATHMPSPAWKMLFRRAWRENDRLRTEGVATVVAAAMSASVGTIVQESFALTYPDRGDAWIDEATPLVPSAYNATVLDAERAIARFTDSGGRGITLRFAAFYGPDAMQMQSYVASVRKGWAGLPGARQRYISSVSHDDAAAAVVAALDAPAGAYNVVDDEPVTRAVFFGTLAHCLGMRPPRFMPAWMTPLLGSVGEAMARSLRLSNRKLRTATQFAPRFASVREGFAAALAQMRAPS